MSLNEIYELRQQIGFVFQTFNLLPSLTVRENVESALVHSNISKEEIEDKIIDCINSGVFGRLII
jgi:ABC-type methionine transport system ATPase subunit